MKHEGENLRKPLADVRTVPLSDVQKLVEQHHYARGGANTATFRHGLFYENQLVGAAWWIPPTRAAAEANWAGDWRKVLTLSRLVCTPDAPRNAASFLISRSVKLIRKDGRFEFLLSYADTWQQHTGAIYRASGWQDLGETAKEAVWVGPDGRMMGRKRGPKTMTKAEMLDAGFTSPGKFSKRRFGLQL